MTQALKNMPATSERYLLNASWLIKLRWVAVVGQLLTIGGASILFRVDIPMLWALWTVIALTAISNAVLHFVFVRLIRHRKDISPPWDLVLGLLMLMDILSLTTLLFASGGPTNPFSLFFFVNLCLSALLLNRVWAWGLNALTILCFGLLIYHYHQIPQLDMGWSMLPVAERQKIFPASGLGGVWIVQLGFFLACGACSSVIV